MLVNDVAFTQLDRNQLPEQRNWQVECFVEIFVDSFIRFDDCPQLIIRC
jgi:hypothetical protein